MDADQWFRTGHVERYMDHLIAAHAIKPFVIVMPSGERGHDSYDGASERFIATELIREKAIRLLGDEIPYGLAVTIEQWTESDGRAVIGATIWVDRESHRGIVIGAGGSKLKQIGRLARFDIEQLLEKPLHLDLWVKLSARWRDDPARMARLGYGLQE